MSEFRIPANDFLLFERGASVDMVLQWATYRDATDQCSLSRIWGGIHPPADDISGRPTHSTSLAQANRRTQGSRYTTPFSTSTRSSRTTVGR